MERKQATTTFFLLALSAIALYFCYVIARPFLSPAFLAVMMAIVFHPVHSHSGAHPRSEYGGSNLYNSGTTRANCSSGWIGSGGESGDQRPVSVAEREECCTGRLEPMGDACDGASCQLGRKVR